ncbi:hypothetical protein KDW_27780 [Dictyobacter vulcani]|uniref:DUF2029 domain-containing protein n=1 Tax=Dictyobacter vulcani TaxID=2607529 RepID=A0A5J4KTT8_9CHLR|nr:glycosyltransferase 87 family protein [Dictyobacter vulcani]GER88616.1 hypothetical protein KDW_27780 [Dictyobacter vulcani]
MPILDLPTLAQKRHVSSSFGDTWRFPLLCFLLLVAIGYSVFLAIQAPPPDVDANQFVVFWLLGFLPYLAACLLILTTRAPVGRRRWRELALILVGALVLRAQLVFLDPNLSHDSWRYLWDARVTLNGFSPYVYPPGHPLLVHLRDFLYANSRFRNVPTIYPPAAQGFYLLSYLLSPENLVFLKCLFIGCELVTTATLAVLLSRKGLDPARCVIYAWCPLPIIEFAIQGHVDALMITFILLIMLCAQSSRRGARVLTGFLLAIATLIKLYPLLLLVVVWRGKRDWALLLTCLVTIVLAYVPYLILGNGQIFGFFASYASEQGSMNGGPLALFLHWISMQTGLPLPVTYVVDLLLVGSLSLWVWLRRLKERISIEAAALLMIGVTFLISTHVFPWYVAALLPFVALLIDVPWSRGGGWNSWGLAMIGLWYFCGASILGYFLSSTLDWTWYYVSVYYVTLIILGLAWLVNYVLPRWPRRLKNHDQDTEQPLAG